MIIPAADAPIKCESVDDIQDADSIIKSEYSGLNGQDDSTTDFIEKEEPAIDFDQESGIANDFASAVPEVGEMEEIGNDSPEEVLEPEAVGRPMKGFALGVLNPKILTWIESKYKIDEGARTAVQDRVGKMEKKDRFFFRERNPEPDI